MACMAIDTSHALWILVQLTHTIFISALPVHAHTYLHMCHSVHWRQHAAVSAHSSDINLHFTLLCECYLLCCLQAMAYYA